MWLMPRMQDKRIQIVISAERITCALLCNAPDKRVGLHAYADYTISVAPSLLLADMPAASKQVAAFIAEHNLVGASVDITVLSPLVQEMLVYTVTPTATEQELVQERLSDRYYAYRLLGPYENHYVWYITTITRALQLQLELLCMHIPAHLATISTGFVAQLQLYKHLQGTSYRVTECTYAFDHTTMYMDIDWTQMVHVAIAATPVHNVSYALGTFLGD